MVNPATLGTMPYLELPCADFPQSSAQPQSTPQQDKPSLRREVFRARRQTSPAQRLLAGRRLAQLAREHQLFQDLCKVALYESFGTEIDSRYLLELARDERCEVLVPQVGAHNEVGWRELSSQETRGPESLAECELVLVPALLVDHGGTRLGRGVAWYDRALAYCRPHTKKVAVCWSWEFVSFTLPAEAHDVRMDAVLCTA